MNTRAAIIVVLLVLIGCSSSDALHEKYRPLDMAIKRGNGYLENLLIQHPSTPVNTASYMNELKRKSTRYYEMLEPYSVEVHERATSNTSGFSVTVWDEDKLVLSDCNDTPEIDEWYYERCVTRADSILPPPCWSPFLNIDE